MSVQIKQSFQTVRVCFWSEERKRRGKDWQSLGVAGPSGARLLRCQDLSKCDNDDVCADEMLFPDCESLFLVRGKEKGGATKCSIVRICENENVSANAIILQTVRDAKSTQAFPASSRGREMALHLHFSFHDVQVVR